MFFSTWLNNKEYNYFVSTFKIFCLYTILYIIFFYFNVSELLMNCTVFIKVGNSEIKISKCKKVTKFSKQNEKKQKLKNTSLLVYLKIQVVRSRYGFSLQKPEFRFRFLIMLLSLLCLNKNVESTLIII